MIEVVGLSKTYRVRARPSSSVWQSLRALFSREFRTVTALDGIDWRVREGQIHGLIGRNGSGKSTLLKILCGILHPTAGSARVNGVVPWADRQRYVRDIGVVFGQKSQLTWELPAVDSFYLHRSLYGVERAQFERTLQFLSDAFEAIVDRPVRSLSLGERMKCEIAAALLHRPQVVFLDEPTIGLDVTMQRRIRAFIAEYNHRYGATVLLTSHYMADVEALCKRVIVIHHGRLLFDGDLSALVQQFTAHKTIVVQLEDCLADLHTYGEVINCEDGRITLRVPKAKTASVTERLLADLPVIDLLVEDPPIEEVIDQVFTS